MIGSKEVQVWTAHRRHVLSLIESLLPVLSIDEHERSARYFDFTDRENFVIRRGLLRVLLGAYLHTPPGLLDIGYGPQGKPYLNLGPTQGLNFNMSFSGDYTLFAFSKDFQLGIDIEKIHHIPEMNQIIEQSFSEDEKQILKKIPAVRREQVFYEYWTAKEAYIKAIGDGLSLPLNEFDVITDSHQHNKSIRSRSGKRGHSRWRISAIDVDPSYSAHIAVKSTKYSIQIRNCSDFIQ